MCGNQVERSEHQFWEESNAGGPIAPREETQVKDDRHASLCVCTTTEMATLQGGKMEGMSGQSSIEQGKKGLCTSSMDERLYEYTNHE